MSVCAPRRMRESYKVYELNICRKRLGGNLLAFSTRAQENENFKKEKINTNLETFVYFDLFTVNKLINEYEEINKINPSQGLLEVKELKKIKTNLDINGFLYLSFSTSQFGGRYINTSFHKVNLINMRKK